MNKARAQCHETKPSVMWKERMQVSFYNDAQQQVSLLTIAAVAIADLLALDETLFLIIVAVAGYWSLQ
jgi:hypothetical protein